MMSHWERRDWLAAASGALGVMMGANATLAAAAPSRNDAEPFGYCLNMSTVRGQNLTLPEQVALAAEAGYHAIEPWIREIETYEKSGGKIADLRKRIDDAGLVVASAIGFAEWIVDDESQRKAGLETARRDMDLIARLGGKFIAAPPAGATKQVGLDLLRAAERYHALCEVGRQIGVRPQAEVWGHSTTLSRLSETMFVIVESGHPDACILPDIYHLFRGGSDFDAVSLVAGQAMHCFHMNDYPAAPPRAEMTDAHRVYPGDGVGPLDQVLRTLRDNGYRGYLSLELFNRDYWQQDARLVARTGLEKMRQAVRRALT